ncbi:MAG: hypothetical protein JW801_04225 [Bacteroidales bacterium]|nr:hypothetical protein [Bacteroidales bacterium]
MKSLKYISIFAILLLALSCEFDENGRMPDSMTESCFPYLALDAETSSPFINTNSPDAYVLNGTINVIFEDIAFDKLEMVVVFDGDYEHPYTLLDNITSVPVDVTITVADLVGAIDELSSAADITIDDNFHIYVIPTTDGVASPPYQVLDGVVYNTVSASLYQNLTALGVTGTGDAEANITVMTVCELANGANDLAGSWTTGYDGWYWPSQITIDAVDETHVQVNGMAEYFIADFWGETVIDGGTFTMEVTPFGTVNIPRQYIYTTDYEGDPYDYEIAGSGFWENCGSTPVLMISYDIYYPGDAAGLAATYAAYLGYNYLYTEIALDGAAKIDFSTPLTSGFQKPAKK